MWRLFKCTADTRTIACWKETAVPWTTLPFFWFTFTFTKRYIRSKPRVSFKTGMCRSFWSHFLDYLSPVPWHTVWLPERIEILYPCTRLQHSPRSFPTYITTVATYRECCWSLHFHFTTMLKRQPNWDPTTDGVLVFDTCSECQRSMRV